MEVTSEAPRDSVTALCEAVHSSQTFLEPKCLGAPTENKKAGRMERGGIRTPVSAGGEDHSVGHAARDGLPRGRAGSALCSLLTAFTPSDAPLPQFLLSKSFQAGGLSSKANSPMRP